MDSWIHTRSGKKVRPLAMTPEMVDLDDIVHALTMKCRWTGHTSEFYSVAQHSVMVSLIAEERAERETKDGRLARLAGLYGLLHDAAEAYLPDVAAPVKRYFAVDFGGQRRTFSDVEDTILAAVQSALRVPPAPVMVHGSVAAADLDALAVEARDLMHGTSEWARPIAAPKDWHIVDAEGPGRPFFWRAEMGYSGPRNWPRLDPEGARATFLHRWSEVRP